MLYVKILVLVLRASLYWGKNVDSGLKIWFVIPVFLPIQITEILPDPKIFRYNGDFVISVFIISGFQFTVKCLDLNL